MEPTQSIETGAALLAEQRRLDFYQIAVEGIVPQSVCTPPGTQVGRIIALGQTIAGRVAAEGRGVVRDIGEARALRFMIGFTHGMLTGHETLCEAEAIMGIRDREGDLTGAWR